MSFCACGCQDGICYCQIDPYAILERLKPLFINTTQAPWKKRCHICYRLLHNCTEFYIRFLAPAGGPRPCKIKPKRCKGVQKPGSHLFKKNGTFLNKANEKWFPLGPPKNPKNWISAGKDLPKTKFKKTWKNPKFKRTSPKVTPTLPEGYPKVHRRSGVRSPQGALAAPSGPTRAARAP